MQYRLAILITALLLATGCASNKMVDSSNQQDRAIDAGKAQVIFMRSSFVGSAVQSTVFDASSDETKFIGILSNGKKLSYMVDPGDHNFMVVSEAADFMPATLNAGKTYYAIITPRMGAWKARFSMVPVRNGGAGKFQVDSDEFREWLSETAYSENTAESNAWYNENRADVDAKRAEYWEVWQQKTDAEKAERTLKPEDGV